MKLICIIFALSTILIQPSLSKKRRPTQKLDGNLDWVTSFRSQRGLPDGNWYTSGHTCGGALIQKTPPIILTAAHCIENAAPNDEMQFVIDIGRKQSDEEGGDYQTLYITDPSNFHQHPMWDISNIDNGYDIALIIVTDPEQTVDKNMGPLPRIIHPLAEDEVCCADNEKLEQIGYSDEEDELEVDSIHYVPGDACLDAFDQEVHPTKTGFYLHELYDEEDEVTPRLVCAQKDGDGVCHGDSGMPLMRRVRRTKNRFGFEIVGVVSYGEECPTDEDARGYPDMWTSVGHYVDWIEETVDGVLGNMDIMDKDEMMVLAEDNIEMPSAPRLFSCEWWEGLLFWPLCLD